MIKHATSHGLSTLTCTLSASLLIEAIKPIWPQVYAPVGKIASQIQLELPWVLTEEFISILIIASVLGLLWGVAFRFTVKRT